MTSKCIKIKNPCKICLAPVSQKNGLQCHGACQTWIHYKCLNYTAGKIKDIKNGTIQVTCPCPDCKTATLPKEYRTDEPFSCTNLKCPANLPPMCEHTNCPSFVDPPHKATQSSACKMPPIRKCGDECKEYAIPSHAPNACQIQTQQNSSTSTVQTMSPAYPSHQSVGDTQFPIQNTVEQMCNTVGQLTNQINELMCKMKEAYNAGGGGYNPGGGGGGCKTGGGGGGGGGCKTGAGRGGGGAGGGPTCGHQGPKSMCPKPCYCPGNPVNNRR